MPARTDHPRRPDLLTEFWFLTSAVALLGPVLAAVALVIDRVSGDAGALPFLAISPDSARTILGSIAGSLITIASLTSSLTIVTLQLLSNQYTPRTVRGFLSTRRSQVVLGTFIGIFLFCLVTLVSVREPGDDNEPFVPSLAVIVSVVLAVLGLLVLVLFIHTMSQTIQVSTTAARIADSTRSAIERVHGSDAAAAEPSADGRPIRAPRTGYVRGVDERILASAPSGTVVSVLVRPGDFVTGATVVALAAGPEADDEKTTAVVRRAVHVEDERDVADDPAYGIRQLADIALRALSPGINDPSTAVTCIGYLRSLLEDLGPRKLPAWHRSGSAVVASPRFADYLEPLVELSNYHGPDSRVVWSLLDALDSVAACCTDEPRRARVTSIRDEVRVAALAEARLASDRDRLAGGTGRVVS